MNSVLASPVLADVSLPVHNALPFIILHSCHVILPCLPQNDEIHVNQLVISPPKMYVFATIIHIIRSNILYWVLMRPISLMKDIVSCHIEYFCFLEFITIYEHDHCRRSQKWATDDKASGPNPDLKEGSRSWLPCIHERENYDSSQTCCETMPNMMQLSFIQANATHPYFQILTCKEVSNRCWESAHYWWKGRMFFLGRMLYRLKKVVRRGSVEAIHCKFFCIPEICRLKSFARCSCCADTHRGKWRLRPAFVRGHLHEFWPLQSTLTLCSQSTYAQGRGKCFVRPCMCPCQV